MMASPGRWACGLMLASMLGSHAAHGADWTLDAGASALRFTASFEAAPAPGRFSRFGVSMRFDPADPAAGTLAVTVDTGSADMGNDDINREIRGADWFDVGRYPRAEFRSARIERSGATGYLASGTLTIKGVTKPIELPFDWKESTDGATMGGTVTIDRSTFGIGAGEWRSTRQVGGAVRVEFALRLRRGG